MTVSALQHCVLTVYLLICTCHMVHEKVLLQCTKHCYQSISACIVIFTALMFRQSSIANHNYAVVGVSAVCCCSGWNDFKDFGKTSAINNLAGTISFIFGLLLWVTSINWVRRRSYQTFHSVHVLGFLGYVLFALLHYPGMWVGTVPGKLPLSPFVTLVTCW